MRRKLELLKLQIKSAFLSIPKIILGTIVTAVLVIAIMHRHCNGTGQRHEDEGCCCVS